MLLAVLAIGLIWAQLATEPEEPSASQPGPVDAAARRRSDPINAIDSRAIQSSRSPSAGASSSQEELTLKEDQRKYLWEVEHHGLLLGKHGFARLAQALRRGETADFLANMSEDFEGRTLREPKESRSETAGVSAFASRIQGAIRSRSSAPNSWPGCLKTARGSAGLPRSSWR